MLRLLAILLIATILLAGAFVALAPASLIAPRLEKSTGGLFSPGDASDVSSYGAEILVDAEVKLRFADARYEIAVGGENVFDVEPDAELDPVLQFLGVSQSLTSPFGFNGAFWYARLGVNF